MTQIVPCTLILLSVFGIALSLQGVKRELQGAIEDNNSKENLSTKKDEKAEGESNPLSSIQQLLSKGGGNMVLGTYQALVMPMPQGQDISNGITNIVQGIQGLFQG